VTKTLLAPPVRETDDRATFITPETQGRDLLQVEDALDDVRAEVQVSR
jgi:hypothetical protein